MGLFFDFFFVRNVESWVFGNELPHGAKVFLRRKYSGCVSDINAHAVHFLLNAVVVQCGLALLFSILRLSTKFLKGSHKQKFRNTVWRVPFAFASGTLRNDCCAFHKNVAREVVFVLPSDYLARVFRFL